MANANNNLASILYLQTFNDGRAVVVFGPHGPSTHEGRVDLLEALGLARAGRSVEFVTAALITPLVAAPVPLMNVDPGVRDDEPSSTSGHVWHDEVSDISEPEEGSDGEEEDVYEGLLGSEEEGEVDEEQEAASESDSSLDSVIVNDNDGERN